MFLIGAYFGPVFYLYSKVEWVPGNLYWVSAAAILACWRHAADEIGNTFFFPCSR